MSSYSIVRIGRDDRTDFTEKAMQGIQDHLREEDAEEIEATCQTVRKGIRFSVFSSQLCYAAFHEEGKQKKMLAIFGLRVFQNENIIWCLATEEMEHYKKSFMKESRKIIKAWAEEFGTLTNAVMKDNTKSVAWLKWLGASFGKSYDVNGQAFVPFYIRSSSFV